MQPAVPGGKASQRPTERPTGPVYGRSFRTVTDERQREYAARYVGCPKHRIALALVDGELYCEECEAKPDGELLDMRQLESEGEREEMTRRAMYSAAGLNPNEHIKPARDFDVDRQALAAKEAGIDAKRARKDAQEAFAAVEEWRGGSLPWLTLAGGNGIGKSHLIKAAILSLARAGTPAHYITAAEFDAAIKNFDKNAAVDPDAWVETLAKKWTFLAVDDVGMGVMASNYNISRFERLFDLRSRLRLSTLVATNLKPEQLDITLGPRIMSRLGDTSMGRILPLDCADVRPHLPRQEEVGDSAKE